MAHKTGNDFHDGRVKSPKFTDKPLTAAEHKARQHRREVMHWKQRMKKLRNHQRLWKQH